MDFRFRYNRKPPPPEVLAREEQQEEEVERRAQGLAYGLSIPFTLAGGPISGWLLGSWVDKLAHTEQTHIWTLVLILIGTAASMKMTIDLLSKLNQK